MVLASTSIGYYFASTSIGYYYYYYCCCYYYLKRPNYILPNATACGRTSKRLQTT